ncbi:MAG: DNA cytosine methyltransferase [Clostridiales bacterium]|nr:DNA cytosine methyltransferase [Clostridiales bacterium]
MSKYRIVDLFSGAGGLTFGFYYNLVNNQFKKRDNVEFVFANEFAPQAVAAFKKNYGDNIPMIAGDICGITDKEIEERLNGEEVDVIIGGPPCQSFSTVGQRKYDDRAKLSNQYLRLLEKIKPKMFLFENVKGILSMREIFYKTNEKGETVYEEVEKHRGDKKFIKKEPVIDHYGDLVMDVLKREFDRIGYRIVHETMVAAKFGVPQNRERVFIIGVRKDLDLEWIYPEGDCEEPLTIYQAISDLPPVKEGGNITEYTIGPMNDYQRLMRGDCKEITQHFCGYYGDKIRTVIQNVAEGEGKNDFNAKVDAGLIDRRYYLTSGYGNTYGRLERNKPSTTITNNLATPSALRCIHYEQDRALTPREGARIQSFPDWYHFEGNRTDVARQVGNAVPPLMAIAFANQIIETLKK